MSDDEKWAAFENVDPECWVPVERHATGAVFELFDGWRDALFGSAYRSIRINADLSLTRPRAVVFVSSHDVYEVRVWSRLCFPQYYDFKWLFWDHSGSDRSPGRGDLTCRVLATRRAGGAGPAAAANAIWVAPTDRPPSPPIAPTAMNFRIFSPDIGETVDLNLSSLQITDIEGEQERQIRMEPWRRYVAWLCRLAAADRAAFARIPPPLRNGLSRFGPQGAGAGALTEAEIVSWQVQGLMPRELAMVTNDDVVPARDSIRLQQRLARTPEVMSQFNGCPIPSLLLTVDADRLDGFDLQVLMTMGALREIHGFLEVEQQRLFQRRPDLQAAMQKPNGQQVVQADSEVMSLMSHPQVVEEQQDQQDVMLRRAGQYGPTGREQLAAMKVQTDQMQAQTLGMVNPLMGFAAMMEAGLGAARKIGPPWKLYIPYLC